MTIKSETEDEEIYKNWGLAEKKSFMMHGVAARKLSALEDCAISNSSMFHSKVAKLYPLKDLGNERITDKLFI